MVPILVQPVGIPTAIAADFLTTTPVGHSVTAKIVLSSSIVRALRDGCGCKQFINTFGDPVANVMGDVTGISAPNQVASPDLRSHIVEDHISQTEDMRMPPDVAMRGCAVSTVRDQVTGEAIDVLQESRDSDIFDTFPRSLAKPSIMPFSGLVQSTHQVDQFDISTPRIVDELVGGSSSEAIIQDDVCLAHGSELGLGLDINLLAAQENVEEFNIAPRKQSTTLPSIPFFPSLESDEFDECNHSVFSCTELEMDFSSLSWTRPSTGTPKVPAFIGGCEATSRSAAVIVGVSLDGKANESSVVPHSQMLTTSHESMLVGHIDTDCLAKQDDVDPVVLSPSDVLSDCAPTVSSSCVTKLEKEVARVDPTFLEWLSLLDKGVGKADERIVFLSKANAANIESSGELLNECKQTFIRICKLTPEFPSQHKRMMVDLKVRFAQMSDPSLCPFKTHDLFFDFNLNLRKFLDALSCVNLPSGCPRIGKVSNNVSSGLYRPETLSSG